MDYVQIETNVLIFINTSCPAGKWNQQLPQMQPGDHVSQLLAMPTKANE